MFGEIGASFQGSSNAFSGTVFAHTIALIGPCDRFEAAGRHLASRSDGRGSRPDDEPALAFNEQRNGKWSGVALVFVGLEFVEMQGGVFGKVGPDVEIEMTQVATDFAQLYFGTTLSKANQSGGFANTDASGDELKQARIQMRSVIVIVHAKGLAREGTPTASALESRYRMRPAFGAIASVRDAKLGLGILVLTAVGMRAMRRDKHGEKTPLDRTVGLYQEVGRSQSPAVTVFLTKFGRANHRKPIQFRYISSKVREQVFELAGHRCEFEGPQGRCDQGTGLELDHTRPFGKLGGSGAGNLRCLCQAHNLW